MENVAVRHVPRMLVVMAMAAAMLVFGAPDDARASGVPCQRTFASTGSTPISGWMFIPMPPDFFPVPVPGFGASSIDVPAGTVADVDVTVNLTHPTVEQLTVAVSHNGSAVLKGAGGPSGANLTGTTFDDEAVQAIASGAPPYSGRYRPAQALTGYDGANATGTWSLSVSNPISPSPGTIDSWSVTVTYASCDFDGDGVEDHSDSCLGISANTATGCTVTTRALTVKYKHGKFKGVLSSPVAACQAAQGVTIWKVRSGADKKVGTATTRSDGVYKLTRAKHPGRYYATTPRVAVTDVAECPAAQSPKFRVG